MSIRPVNYSSQTKPAMEGAGVHLHRVFGFGETEPFDPFLMMDDFRNDDPNNYVKGFPWHPHRGIETITYVLKGNVEHSDSLGNNGTLSDGDVRNAILKGMPIRESIESVFQKEPTVLIESQFDLSEAKKMGLRPSIYTHPLGSYGHSSGPTIGMWDAQGGVEGTGDYPLNVNTVYAI